MSKEALLVTGYLSSGMGTHGPCGCSTKGGWNCSREGRDSQRHWHPGSPFGQGAGVWPEASAHRMPPSWARGWMS